MDALVERDREIAALRAFVDLASAGVGGAAVLVGPPGIGKSALLGTVGGATLRARGGEFEQEFPYGLVRQLFEGALRTLDDSSREAVLAGPAGPAAALLLKDAGRRGAPSDAFALEHAFYWLTAHLAEQGPVVLVVDDAHWADLSSLRVLLYLVRRIADLPVAVVVATRPMIDSRGPLIDSILAEAATVLEPAPLTADGVGSLVKRALQSADDAFCQSCHVASGGIPFLVTELVEALRTSGIEPIGRNAGRVRPIGARSVTRSVLLRLRGLGPAPVAVARALAVLGDSQSSELLADLAAISVPEATSAIEKLRMAHIVDAVDPPCFVHSIVRDAVCDDVPAGEQSRLHRAAAAFLSASGADLDVVAGHLLLTAPGVDTWTFEQLVTASSSPHAAAAPESAASYLDRALRETVPGVDRAPLLFALGAARFQIVCGDALGPLQEARASATDARLRLDATRALASAYMTLGRFADSWSLIEDSIVEFVDEPDLVCDLEIYSAQLLYSEIDAAGLQVLLARTQSWHPSLSATTVRDRSMLALQAWVASSTCSPAKDIAALANAALSMGALVDDDVWYVSIDLAVWSLITAGQYDEANAHLNTAIDSCLAAGRLLRAATLLPIRAELRRRIGQLSLGMEDARLAFEVIPADQIYAPHAASAYVLALMDAGDLGAARRVLAGRGFDRAIPIGGCALVR